MKTALLAAIVSRKLVDRIKFRIDYFMYIAFDMVWSFFSLSKLSDRFNETVVWIIIFLIMKVLKNNLLRVTIDLVPFKPR